MAAVGDIIIIIIIINCIHTQLHIRLFQARCPRKPKAKTHKIPEQKEIKA